MKYYNKAKVLIQNLAVCSGLYKFSKPPPLIITAITKTE